MPECERCEGLRKELATVVMARDLLGIRADARGRKIMRMASIIERLEASRKSLRGHNKQLREQLLGREKAKDGKPDLH